MPASDPPARLRLGETADEVWASFRQLSANGFVTRRGLLYPVARIPGDSCLYGVGQRLDGSSELRIEGDDLTFRKASDQEADRFHADLDGDRVEIVCLTRPGYMSGFGRRELVQVLHSPRGNHLAAPTHAPHGAQGVI